MHATGLWCLEAQGGKGGLWELYEPSGDCRSLRCVGEVGVREL